MLKSKLVAAVLFSIMLGSSAQAAVVYNWVYSANNVAPPGNIEMSLVFTDEAFASGTVDYDNPYCQPVGPVNKCADPDSPIIYFQVRQPAGFGGFSLFPQAGLFELDLDRLSVHAVLGNQFLRGSILATTLNHSISISGGALMTITSLRSDNLGGGGCIGNEPDACNGATGFFVREGFAGTGIPEPSTHSLFALAIFGLFALRLRPS
jgi:hypothetical protein